MVLARVPCDSNCLTQLAEIRLLLLVPYTIGIAVDLEDKRQTRQRTASSSLFLCVCACFFCTLRFYSSENGMMTALVLNNRRTHACTASSLLLYMNTVSYRVFFHRITLFLFLTAPLLVASNQPIQMERKGQESLRRGPRGPNPSCTRLILCYIFPVNAQHEDCLQQ